MTEQVQPPSQPPPPSYAPPSSDSSRSALQSELDALRRKGLATIFNKHFTSVHKALEDERREYELALAEMERRKEEIRKNPLAYEDNPDAKILMTNWESKYMELQKKKLEMQRKERETQELYRRYISQYGQPEGPEAVSKLIKRSSSGSNLAMLDETDEVNTNKNNLDMRFSLVRNNRAKGGGNDKKDGKERQEDSTVEVSKPKTGEVELSLCVEDGKGDEVGQEGTDEALKMAKGLEDETDYEDDGENDKGKCDEVGQVSVGGVSKMKRRLEDGSFFEKVDGGEGFEVGVSDKICEVGEDSEGGVSEMKKRLEDGTFYEKEEEEKKEEEKHIEENDVTYDEVGVGGVSEFRVSEMRKSLEDGTYWYKKGDSQVNNTVMQTPGPLKVQSIVRDINLNDSFSAIPSSDEATPGLVEITPGVNDCTSRTESVVPITGGVNLFPSTLADVNDSDTTMSGLTAGMDGVTVAEVEFRLVEFLRKETDNIRKMLSGDDVTVTSASESDISYVEGEQSSEAALRAEEMAREMEESCAWMNDNSTAIKEEKKEDSDTTVESGAAWTAHWCKDNRREYYHDKTSNVSTWTRPRGVDIDTALLDEVIKEKLKAKKKDFKKPVLEKSMYENLEMIDKFRPDRKRANCVSIAAGRFDLNGEKPCTRKDEYLRKRVELQKKRRNRFLLVGAVFVVVVAHLYATSDNWLQNLNLNNGFTPVSDSNLMQEDQKISQEETKRMEAELERMEAELEHFKQLELKNSDTQPTGVKQYMINVEAEKNKRERALELARKKIHEEEVRKTSDHFLPLGVDVYYPRIFRKPDIIKKMEEFFVCIEG